MNFEKLNNSNEKIKSGTDKALDYLKEAKNNRSNHKDPKFKEVFTESELEKDNQLLNYLKDKAKNKEYSIDSLSPSQKLELEDNKLKAKVLESTILYGLNETAWLGTDVDSQTSAEYDDWINHVDIVSEIKPNNIDKKDLKSIDQIEFFGLGLDATYNEDLRAKVLRITEEIKGNYPHHEQTHDPRQSDEILGRAKYYNAINLDYQGRIKNIPRAVVSADKNTVEAMIKCWEKYPPTETNKDIFEESSFRFQFIEELAMQFDFYAKFAEKNNRHEEAQIFKIMLNHFVKAYQTQNINEKTNINKDKGNRDSGFSNLKNILLDIDDTIELIQLYQKQEKPRSPKLQALLDKKAAQKK